MTAEMHTSYQIPGSWKWNRFSIPNPRCYTVNSIFMTDSDSVFHIVEIIGPCVFFRWCVSLSTRLCFSTESWRRVLAVMSWREMYQCCCSFCCLGTPPSSGIRPHRALPSIRPRRVRVKPSTDTTTSLTDCTCNNAYFWVASLLSGYFHPSR